MLIKKELLIIYKAKDEELFDHIESLLLSEDDSDTEMVGVKDNSVAVYKSLFSIYGKLQDSADKFLFVDCAPKNYEKCQLFNKFGVSYGSIDSNKMYIMIDGSFKWDKNIYGIFLRELHSLLDKPIADIVAFKEPQDRIPKTPLELSLRLASVVPVIGIPMQVNDIRKDYQNKATLRKQLLYYGLTKMYLDNMESLIND